VSLHLHTLPNLIWNLLKNPKSIRRWFAELARFRHVFRTPQSQAVLAMAGNHDIGLAYNNFNRKAKRFLEAFGPLNQFLELKGVKIAAVNTLCELSFLPCRSSGSPFGSRFSVFLVV